MIIRWKPFQEVESMRSQVDRTFQNMSSLAEESARNEWYPATELFEIGNQLVLRAIAPGIDPNSLDIQVTRDSISISGERNHLENPQTQNQDSGERRYLWSEIRYGKFHRLINLPMPVQNEAVEADYADGVLTLTLPKANEVKAFKVNLSGLKSFKKTINPSEAVSA